MILSPNTNTLTCKHLNFRYGHESGKVKDDLNVSSSLVAWDESALTVTSWTVKPSTYIGTVGIGSAFAGVLVVDDKNYVGQTLG